MAFAGAGWVAGRWVNFAIISLQAHRPPALVLFPLDSLNLHRCELLPPHKQTDALLQHERIIEAICCMNGLQKLTLQFLL
jgi:hypothetical protein